jgi:short-subunit dehydrogenase
MKMYLAGKRVLVAGASGEVGRGAAFALNKAGASVTLIGRSATKLAEVQSTFSNPDATSEILAVDYSTVSGAKELKEKIAGKTYDIVVASSGPWWTATLADSDLETLESAMHGSFAAHINLFNVLAKSHMTPQSGQYLLCNGGAAFGLPQMGLPGVLNNAVMGASKVMHYECSKNQSSMPTFTEVMICTSVGHGQSRQDTNDPKEFGNIFVAMALGLHEKDDHGQIKVDDAMFEKLVAKLN